MKDKSISAQLTRDLFTDKINHGGHRKNSGRKPSYDEPTKTVRVPVSLAKEVKAYANARYEGKLDSVTELLEKVTESSDSVTESSDMLKILEILEKYKKQSEPYFPKSKSARGSYRVVCALFEELQPLLSKLEDK